MLIFKTAIDIHNYLDLKRKKGEKCGFVPTMGALHAGHISLVESCKRENDTSVVSIFVNPTQFNDKKDFEKYPLTPENDISLLEQAGCDILFMPAAAEIYPGGIIPSYHYDLGELETVLEGKFRPGHFQGVCMVVDRLLHIVNPNRLYLGRKDYQQCMVIARLLELTNSTVELKIGPTLREQSGLAMSSRNTRLTPEQRSQAAKIYAVLDQLRQHLVPGGLQSLQSHAVKQLEEAGFRVDYVSIANAATLHPVVHWDGHTPLVALVAAFLGEVRLIDNLALTGNATEL